MHLLKGLTMDPVNAASGRENVKFDVERINRLVADLAAEVARAPADAPGIQDLRDEIETLRAVLNSPRTRHHWIDEGLHAVRDAAHAVRGELVRDSVYVTEIGRILGL